MVTFSLALTARTPSGNRLKVPPEKKLSRVGFFGGVIRKVGLLKLKEFQIQHGNIKLNSVSQIPACCTANG